jgi:hypothetical protein
VTSTTTGDGDLVLPLECRLVGGVEALTWHADARRVNSLFFAVLAKTFELPTSTTAR